MTVRHTSAQPFPVAQTQTSDVLLNRVDAAYFLGIKPQTLAVWASTHRYQLPYIKIGRRAMYRRVDLDAFVMANRRTGTEVAV